jgi:nucleotide-binding universal stress UspA family protein
MIKMGSSGCPPEPIEKERDMPGITVGVDGSHDAHKALEWAMKEAAAHHAPLTVLTVHEVAASGWTGSPIILPPDLPAVEEARQAAEETVRKALSQLGESRPASVTVHAVNGVAAEELINASRDADLVVVGFRGASGFGRVVLGSVSNKLVHHAHCPVVVVPDGR